MNEALTRLLWELPMNEGDELEDDTDYPESDCEVCGELTQMRCCGCMAVICSDCECRNGCDAPRPMGEPMTQVVTSGLSVLAEFIRDRKKEGWSVTAWPEDHSAGAQSNFEASTARRNPPVV